MREIKFRAWDKNLKKFHYPDLWDNSMPSNWRYWYELNQWTGLKDQNGIEIYEGDIIEIHTPYRSTQTHYGENIPHPSRQYTEPLEPEIKTEQFEVKWGHGMFYIKEDGDFTAPLSWALVEYTTRQELIDAFGGCSNWIDKAAPGEDDLGYLLEYYPPNNEDDLMKYISGCEVIGNCYENPELLKGA